MFDVNSTDKNKTESGVWGDFGGGKFLIAHTSNLSFQREFNRLQQPYRKQIDRNRLDPKVSTEIMCKAMAKGLLLDWKGVGESGKPIDYSEEMAAQVLIANEDLREFVQDFALNLDNFKQEVTEEAGKS